MNEAMSWLNNGLAVVIVLALGYAGWKTIVWLGENVIVPAKNALLKHLDTVDGTLQNVGESLKCINQSLKDVHSRVQSLIDVHDPFFKESLKDRKRINERLDALEKDTNSESTT